MKLAPPIRLSLILFLQLFNKVLALREIVFLKVAFTSRFRLAFSFDALLSLYLNVELMLLQLFLQNIDAIVEVLGRRYVILD